MFTRRDTLRFAAATAAARHLPFSLSPEEATAKMDESTPFAAGATPSTHDPSGFPLPSPVEFADTMRQAMNADAFGWFTEGALEEYAAYRRALQAVSDAAPDLFPMEGINALGLLDDAVMNLCMTSWNSGVGIGAELEHVRQAMLRPVAVCHRCHGTGREKYVSSFVTPDMQPGDPPGVCRTCSGAGILPVKAV